MRDRSLIYIGLIVFLGIITVPFTYNLATGRTAVPPELTLPEQETQCVEGTEYMRSSHMQLLLQWREDFVRKNIREYTSMEYGKTYEVGLTGTCLKQCHTNKAEFCDRCHEYAAVEGPYCMDCHIDPTEAQGGRR
jgi:hypothetical protein